MLTNNVSQDRTIPYWDEIKKLSIEDKYLSFACTEVIVVKEVITPFGR